ncbi:Elongator complex protein 4 [Infundibulicybe gibba]|nr:Elongator complex protein 4 [Infundibulicybe gibba]
MSSFKRKVAHRVTLYPGTKISPASLSTIITSTGIPSLDDILGGGLPLSCALLITAPDRHSSYGELTQKYFIAQGIAAGQRVCVVDVGAVDFVKDIMWIPAKPAPALDGDNVDEGGETNEQKIKIAWRYERMKQFQTTVNPPSTEVYCQTFDLSHRIPESIVDGELMSGRLSCIDPSTSPGPLTNVIHRIAQLLSPDVSPSPDPLRICIPALGSPAWGDTTSQDILYFLMLLRLLLRSHPHACASISLPPYISTEAWGGPGWLQKLGWLTDAALTLSAFTADPSLLTAFPSHHGLLQIHTLPSPHTLISPSDKSSLLRGLISSSASAGGGGENNLAFKCTRKRLIFETLHLDLEGGIGERRTTPSSNTLNVAADLVHGLDRRLNEDPKAAFPTLEVQFEKIEGEKPAATETNVERKILDMKPKKSRKTVAFQSDRPDLYDF